MKTRPGNMVINFHVVSCISGTINKEKDLSEENYFDTLINTGGYQTYTPYLLRSVTVSMCCTNL